MAEEERWWDDDDIMKAFDHLLWCIEDTKDDPEFAGSYESTLRDMALLAITNGDHKGYTAQKVAEKALSSNKINYRREFCSPALKHIARVWWSRFITKIYHWPKLKRAMEKEEQEEQENE